MPARHLHRIGLHFEVDTGDLVAAILLLRSSALAKLSKANMAILAEFNSGGDQHAVDIHASLTLELEQHVDQSGLVCSTAQNPPATTKDRTGEGADKARWVFHGDSLHLHRPGYAFRRPCVLARHSPPPNAHIGAGCNGFTHVPESNGAWPSLKHHVGRCEDQVLSLVIEVASTRDNETA